MKRRTPTQHDGHELNEEDKEEEEERGGVVLEEWRGGRMMRTHPSTAEGGRGRREDAKAGGRGTWGGALRAVLLPEGYPHSVSDDYATYQAWDTVQALCSSVTGLLCTRALLQGTPMPWPALLMMMMDECMLMAEHPMAQEWAWAKLARHRERQRSSGLCEMGQA